MKNKKKKNVSNDRLSEKTFKMAIDLFHLIKRFILLYAFIQPGCLAL